MTRTGWGVFSTAYDGLPRVGLRTDDGVLDVTAAAIGSAYEQLFAGGSLDRLLAAGPGTWRGALTQAQAWAVDADRLHPEDQLRLHLPFSVADYVDFYSSEQHATNVGRLFRPDAPALPAAWRYLPIGYHGRAGTVVVSGSDVVRPAGQRRRPDGTIAVGPSRRLDIEAEVGFVVGVPSRLGVPVPLSAAAEHVFGVCLVNDWSARDIQTFEYVPLGPFLGKSFATSMSAWVIPLDALRAARVPAPAREPQPVDYLREDAEPWGLDLTLDVRLNGHLVSRPPFAGMYWTFAQQLAHLTVNGASLRTGDLFASGTVSGVRPDQWGSLLELTWNGAEPLVLPDGTTRTFLEDGDEVVIAGSAPAVGGGRVELGEVRGRVVAAATADDERAARPDPLA